MLSIVPVRARNSAGFKVVIWRILSGDSPVLAKLVKLLVNRLARCLSLPLFEGKFLEHRNPDGQRSGLRRLLVRKRVSKVAGRKAKEASSISGRRCCLDRMGLRTKCRHGRPASSSISTGEADGDTLCRSPHSKSMLDHAQELLSRRYSTLFGTSFKHRSAPLEMNLFEDLGFGLQPVMQRRIS
jgi:hypothetical protein